MIAERANCLAATRLRFSTLWEIKQDIHGLFSRIRKAKPLISLKNRISRQRWARSLLEWPISHWEDVAFEIVYLSLRGCRFWNGLSLTERMSLLKLSISHWEDVAFEIVYLSLIFSDECRFSLLNDSGVQRVWRANKEARNPMFYHLIVSNSLPVMVWGLVGPNVFGHLVICEQSLASDYYIEILKNSLKASVKNIHGYPSHAFIFQQDNAPCYS